MAGADTEFWLDYAKNKITAGIEAREKAAEKLDTFLAWLWGIYSGVFALGSFFDYFTNNLLQLLLLLLPLFMIMWARYRCIHVSMPIDSVKMDPNIVTEIMEGYDNVVEIKSTRLRNAQVWVFISIFSLVLAFFGYNYFDAQKELKNELQVKKLNKSLKEQDITVTQKPDSLKRENEILEYEINILINQRKKEYLQKNCDSCLKKFKEIIP